MSNTKFKPIWTGLDDAPTVLTVQEAAWVARVCPRTIRAEIDSGRLRARRLGRTIRILKTELSEYLEGR